MIRNTVGSRELKVRLGTYLRRVRAGRTLIVTDRGQPVAVLRPIEAETTREAILAKLEAEGAVVRPAVKPLSAFKPVASRGRSASAAVIEDRDDRV
jgi:prevent-host-death family protein